MQNTIYPPSISALAREQRQF